MLALDRAVGRVVSHTVGKPVGITRTATAAVACVPLCVCLFSRNALTVYLALAVLELTR